MKLTYQFEPGADADGVTVHVPLPVLNQVSADGFDWQIPGLREELITALIRSLPKHAAAQLRARRPTTPGRCSPGVEPGRRAAAGGAWSASCSG